MKIYLKARSLLSLILLIIAALILASCEPPAYRNITVEQKPVSESMINAMITLDDIPDISRKGQWKLRELSEMNSMWQWSNPINVLAHEFEHWNKTHGEVPIRQLISQYSSEPVAESVWDDLREERIINTFAHSVTKEISLFPEESQPMIMADNISYRCEQYYDLPRTNTCIARLRYGRYYTQVIGQITRSELTIEHFFELVRLLDNRMQILNTNKY